MAEKYILCTNNILALSIYMKIPLKQLATVQVGYSFRARLEPSAQGNLAVIQMKDLRSDNTVDCGELTKIEYESIKAHHLVRPGDLVFRTRGLDTTAAIVLDAPEAAVVASPLLRIRIKNALRLLPEYLNWYISQPKAQAFLTSRARGTGQKMITKQALDELEVVLPSVARQRQIAALADLSAREESLLLRLGEGKKQFMSHQLMQFARGNES